MYKVLMVEVNNEIRIKTKEELTKRGLTIVDVDNLEDGILKLKSDGDIQIVLLNWQTKKRAKSSKLDMIGVEIFKQILKIRYEVNIFLYTVEKDPRKIGGKGLISGYFYKFDYDYDDMFRKITSTVKEKTQSPFFDKLV